jgi:hypothetical protein
MASFWWAIASFFWMAAARTAQKTQSQCASGHRRHERMERERTFLEVARFVACELHHVTLGRLEFEIGHLLQAADAKEHQMSNLRSGREGVLAKLNAQFQSLGQVPAGETDDTRFEKLVSWFTALVTTDHNLPPLTKELEVGHGQAPSAPKSFAWFLATNPDSQLVASIFSGLSHLDTRVVAANLRIAAILGDQLFRRVFRASVTCRSTALQCRCCAAEPVRDSLPTPLNLVLDRVVASAVPRHQTSRSVAHHPAAHTSLRVLVAALKGLAQLCSSAPGLCFVLGLDQGAFFQQQADDRFRRIIAYGLNHTSLFVREAGLLAVRGAGSQLHPVVSSGSVSFLALPGLQRLTSSSTQLARLVMLSRWLLVPLSGRSTKASILPPRTQALHARMTSARRMRNVRA